MSAANRSGSRSLATGRPLTYSPLASIGTALSHPCAIIGDMEIILVFTTVAAILVAGVLAARQRGHRAGESMPDTLKAQVEQSVDTLVAQRDAQVKAAVDAAVAQTLRVANESFSQMVAVAGQSFDARLATGESRLESQGRAIDRSVGDMKSGFDRQMTAMNVALQSLSENAAGQHGQISKHLSTAIRQTAALTETTEQLKNVLSNPTARGQWGERMAEDILRVVGLKEGVSYVKQTTISSGGRPDYTFLMPKNEKLHMDVKFPLDAYARYVEANSDGERSEAAKEFKGALRAHVAALAKREGYMGSRDTLDCVLMFIPNDSVYAFIQEDDGCRALSAEALSKGVLICSPSTLLAVLVIVRKAMDTFALQRSSDQVLESLAVFQKEWGKFAAAIDTVKGRLDTLDNGVQQLLPGGTRRNVLERQLEAIERLRAMSESGSRQAQQLAAAAPETAAPAESNADLSGPEVQAASATTAEDDKVAA